MTFSINKQAFFKVDKPKLGSVYLRYNRNLHKRQKKTFFKGNFSGVAQRHYLCNNNPFRASQPGLVVSYYWGYHLNRKNQGPIKIFSKKCPIGRNIRKSKQLKKFRKIRVWSSKNKNYHFKLNHNSSSFKKLKKKLFSFPGLITNLTHKTKWIHELGKVYPILGG